MPHKFTMPNKVFNNAKEIFTVVVRQNEKYEIWVSKSRKRHRLVRIIGDSVIVSRLSFVGITRDIILPYFYYDVKELAYEISHLLFNQTI